MPYYKRDPKRDQNWDILTYNTARNAKSTGAFVAAQFEKTRKLLADSGREWRNIIPNSVFRVLGLGLVFFSISSMLNPRRECPFSLPFLQSLQTASKTLEQDNGKATQSGLVVLGHARVAKETFQQGPRYPRNTKYELLSKVLVSP